MLVEMAARANRGRFVVKRNGTMTFPAKGYEEDEDDVAIVCWACKAEVDADNCYGDLRLNEERAICVPCHAKTKCWRVCVSCTARITIDTRDDFWGEWENDRGAYAHTYKCDECKKGYCLVVVDALLASHRGLEVGACGKKLTPGKACTGCDRRYDGFD